MEKGVIESQLKMDYIPWSQLEYGMVQHGFMK